MGVSTKKDWTIFFLAKSLDDSINDLIQMLKELLEVPYNNAVSIVFCLNVYKEHKGNIERQEPLPLTTPFKGDITTLFYSIENKDGNNFLNFINDDINFDITDAGSLTSFFKTINGQIQSDRHIIFTWDHGSSYAVFKSPPIHNTTGTATKFEDVMDIKGGLLPLANKRSRIVQGQPHIAVNKDSLSVVEQVATTSDQPSILLTVEELSEAIENGFEKRKVEIVIMMNCNMQLFDAGYALRKTVKYFVAPESYMYYIGYNYRAIFSLLGKDPHISSRRLAKHMVRSFRSKNFSDAQDGNAAKESTALYANNLSYYEYTAKLIGRLSSSLNKKLPTQKAEIEKARKNIIPFASASRGIDFFNLVYNLRNVMGKRWAWFTIFKLHVLRHLIIEASYIGSDYQKTKKKMFPSGFTIFFPIQVGAIMMGTADFEFYLNTHFSDDIPWNCFVLNFVPGFKSPACLKHKQTLAN